MSRYPYGRRPHTRDGRDYRARRPVGAYTGQPVDLEAGFGPVEDQGQLGSCVAFGSCAALDFARRRQGLQPAPLSELFVYYGGRQLGGYPLDQDTGLEIRDGIQALAKLGAPPAQDWPYDIARFADRPPAQAYTDAAADEAVVYGAVQPAAVDDMIAAGTPVVIGFDVYESFESDAVATTGVMPVPGKNEQLLGGHCVVLCSTPVDGSTIGGVPGMAYRKARNSWSTDWGKGGYFYYPDAAMRYASDFWQVTTVSDPVPPTPPGPTPSPDPHDGPAQAELDLAAALHGDHDWVNRRHIGHTHTIATAGRAWLHWRGL